MGKICCYCFVFLCVFILDVDGQTVKSNDKSFDQLIYSKIEYNQLSDDVKLQINKNKLADEPLFEGIFRSYIVEVKTVDSKIDIEKSLSFLYEQHNIKAVNLIADHRIEIISSIETEAIFFKELFSLHNVNSNFIEQKFVVCKAQ